MPDLRERFPYTAIRPEEEIYIFAVCDGRPARRLDPIRNFLLLHGLPLTHDLMVGYQLELLREGMLSTDPDAQVVGRHQFNRGANLYAALLHIAADRSSIQLDPAAVASVRDFARADRTHFEQGCYDDASRIPSLSTIIDGLSPALVGRTEYEQRMTLVGAGALHILVTDSDLFSNH